jgi:hypothetical protein
MAIGIHKGKTNKRGLAAAMRHASKCAFEAVARRLMLAGAVLAMLLAMFAVEALSSGAATMRTGTRPTVTKPKVTTPTITTPTLTTPTVTTPTVLTPARKTPAVSTPGVSVPPVTTPSVKSTPSLSVLGGQGASAPSGSDVLAPSSAAARQRHVRSMVLRLSGCLATLQPRAQRVLLLLAGIGTAGPDSPSTVARTSHISRVREARVEHAALVELSAARQDRCASTLAALIHVPAQNRLVSVDPVLMGQGSSGGTQALRASVSAVGNAKAERRSR